MCWSRIGARGHASVGLVFLREGRGTDAAISGAVPVAPDMTRIDGVTGTRPLRAPAVLRAGVECPASVARKRPDRMQLRPGMRSVIDIGACEEDAIADARRRQVPVISRHQLHHQGAVLL